MKLYNFFRSGTSHRLRIALNLKGQAYEQVAVDLRKEEHLSAAYAAINPQQLVPALGGGQPGGGCSIVISHDVKLPALLTVFARGCLDGVAGHDGGGQQCRSDDHRGDDDGHHRGREPHDETDDEQHDRGAVEEISDSLAHQRKPLDLRAAHEYGVGFGGNHGNHPAPASKECNSARIDSNEKCCRARCWL